MHHRSLYIFPFFRAIYEYHTSKNLSFLPWTILKIFLWTKALHSKCMTHWCGSGALSWREMTICCVKSTFHTCMSCSKLGNHYNSKPIWTICCLEKGQNTETMLHHITSLRHVRNTQLGSSTPSGLLTRLGSFRLPLVCIDESSTCWAAL